MPIIGYKLGTPLTAEMVQPEDNEDQLQIIISRDESQEDTIRALIDGAAATDRYLNGEPDVEELDEEECMLPGECHRITLFLHSVETPAVMGGAYKPDRGANRVPTR